MEQSHDRRPRPRRRARAPGSSSMSSTEAEPRPSALGQRRRRPPGRGDRHHRDRASAAACCSRCSSSRPSLLFSNTTPTGGDMGAHVWGPAYLRDHILPHWRLTGWANDWYAGFPMYVFYMLPPALMVVALDVVLPYGEALKIVSALGILTPADLLLGLREALRHAVPDPAAPRRRLGRVPVRRELPDLRREHRVDDGGRVLVLHRPVVRDALLRRLRLRAAHGQPAPAGRRPVRPGLPVPRHRHLLRDRRHRRAVDPVVGQAGHHQVRRRRSPSSAGCSARSGSCRSSCCTGTGPTCSTSATTTTWKMLFPSAAASTGRSRSFAAIGLLGSVLRRSRPGVFLGVMSHQLRRWAVLQPQSLLWNNRLLPFMYLTRYMLAAVGLVELVPGRRHGSSTPTARWLDWGMRLGALGVGAIGVYLALGLHFRCCRSAGSSTTTASRCTPGRSRCRS